MAEGDTILRASRRIEAALAGQRLSAEAPHPRGRAAGVERLDGLTLRGASARGKHLLLDFGDLVLHSHLGMSGSWHLYERGDRWRRPRRAAWLALSGNQWSAVQFGGPSLRVMRPEQARRDRRLLDLGPDILAADFSLEAAVASLRRADRGRGLGDALLDQGLVAGIGNIFKSEGCFAAAVDPWRRLGDLGDDQVGAVLASTHELMSRAVEDGRHPRAVYRRAGEPCPRCGGPIRSRGQGDANRRTYWCPGCQA